MLRTEFVYNPPCEVPDFWTMSELELAKACRVIAELPTSPAIELVQAETVRLYHIWCETLRSPNRRGPERERRNFILVGLRKRTIQILVRMAMSGMVAAVPTTPVH